MRQEILVGLVVVTLITNVVLGVELYNAVHKPITSGLTAPTSFVSTTSITGPASQTGLRFQDYSPTSSLITFM